MTLHLPMMRPWLMSFQSNSFFTRPSVIRPSPMVDETRTAKTAAARTQKIEKLAYELLGALEGATFDSNDGLADEQSMQHLDDIADELDTALRSR
jgi:hypothetical protein